MLPLQGADPWGPKILHAVQRGQKIKKHKKNNVKKKKELSYRGFKREDISGEEMKTAVLVHVAEEFGS